MKISDPISGEMFDTNNLDSLGDGLQVAIANLNRAKQFMDSIRQAISSKATFKDDTGEEKKTVRLRGERFRFIVEAPEDSWDNSALQNIVQTFPKEAKDVIKPSSQLRVSTREYKKILLEKGNAKFMKFREALIAANRGKVGLPTVKIEE